MKTITLILVGAIAGLLASILAAGSRKGTT